MEKRKWRSPLRPEQGPCWWKLKFAVEAPADALLDTLREIVNEGVLLRIPTIGNEASSGYIVGCLGHRLHGTRYGVSMAAQVHSQNSRVWVTRNVLELQTFVGGVVPVWVEARLYDPLYAVFLGRLVKRIASRWPLILIETSQTSGAVSGLAAEYRDWWTADIASQSTDSKDGGNVDGISTAEIDYLVTLLKQKELGAQLDRSSLVVDSVSQTKSKGRPPLSFYELAQRLGYAIIAKAKYDEGARKKKSGKLLEKYTWENAADDAEWPYGSHAAGLAILRDTRNRLREIQQSADTDSKARELLEAAEKVADNVRKGAKKTKYGGRHIGVISEKKG